MRYALVEVRWPLARWVLRRALCGGRARASEFGSTTRTSLARRQRFVAPRALPSHPVVARLGRPRAGRWTPEVRCQFAVTKGKRSQHSLVNATAGIRTESLTWLTSPSSEGADDGPADSALAFAAAGSMSFLKTKPCAFTTSLFTTAKQKERRPPSVSSPARKRELTASENQTSHAFRCGLVGWLLLLHLQEGKSEMRPVQKQLLRRKRHLMTHLRQRRPPSRLRSRLED